MLKRRKPFDTSGRLNRAIILADGIEYKEKAGAYATIPVFARKDALSEEARVEKDDKCLEGLAHADEQRKAMLNSRIMSLNKMDLAHIDELLGRKATGRYVRIGNLGLRMLAPPFASEEHLASIARSFNIPAERNMRILQISDFHPKADVDSHEICVERKGIGTAAVRRVMELAKSVAKPEEKVYVICGTSGILAQRTFVRLGFKEKYGRKPADDNSRVYFRLVKK